MRKSTAIAQCLVNSEFVLPLERAEHAVRVIFDDEFPDKDFNEWNQNIDETTAANIIRAVGKASRINVKKFIKDLW